MRKRLTSQSVLGYTAQYLTVDGEPWFPVMGEIHYSRVEAARWEEELYKMKAGGIDLVSAYTIWIHHEEVENEWDFSGNKDLRAFLQTIQKCGMHCVLRIGPWAHGEVRNGGFPDWLMQKEKDGLLTTRTNDPAYLAEVKKFYEQIGQQAKGLLLEEGGPIAMIQIENEYGHVGGRTGEEGEEHMRTLRQMAIDAGLRTQIYTATGWGGAVTGGMLPVMGGYCEAPWDQRLTEIEPSGNYLFTRERNDHNIGSDHGLGIGITFDMDKFPYLTAELGGGLQVTKHRRPVATGTDTEAMSMVKLGSGCNLLGYYMYHGGTNPEGKLTTLQESRATGYPNDLPVKSYDFNAPIREYGQLSDSYRRIRRLTMFVHDFGDELTGMQYIPQPGNPDKVDDLQHLRTAVRCNEQTGQGYFFVNNYVRHYETKKHENAELMAYGADGRSVLADFGSQDVETGAFFFYPFRMPLGDKAVLEQAHATPLCCLRNAEGKPDTYVFYTKNDREPSYRTSGDLDGITLLTLTEQESLQAQKVILEGREVLLISEADCYQSMEDIEKGAFHSLLRTDKADTPAVRFYPACKEKTPDYGEIVYGEIVNSVCCRMMGEQSRNDGEDLTVRVHVDGVLKELNEAILCVEYEGESAELYLDGQLVADSFYTGQIWEIGLKKLAPQGHAELTMVIHPLREDAPIYLEKWPAMESGVACRVKGMHTEIVAGL